MEIINNWPPNIEDIKQALEINEKCVFCYGDKIYAPDAHEIPPEIIYHESIHSKQQGNNPKEWWYKYLLNKGFRLDQEIEAYAKQLAFVKKYTNSKRTEIELEEEAKALSGKEYGNLLTFDEAKTFIRKQSQRYKL